MARAVDTVNDWIVPALDEDENSKFCVWSSTDYKAWFTEASTTTNQWETPYECTEMRCNMARRADTSDANHDFKFVWTTDLTAKWELKIPVGRAFL